MRNTEVQEREEHDQAVYTAKADEGYPRPAEQEHKELKVKISVAAGGEWDATTVGGGVPVGGVVTTTYDGNHNPIDFQVRTAEGELVTHIVRTYDSEDRLTEEKLLLKNMPTSILSWTLPHWARDT